MLHSTDIQKKSIIQLDVIIVGAGLAGLAAAVSISLSGHRVTVIESAKELLEVGAGLQVTPNCTRILQRWGLPDRLWLSAAEPSALIVHRYSGKVLAREDNFDKKIRSQYGAPFIDLHRVDLQLSLYEKAKGLGVEFKLGEKVISVDFHLPSVTAESGLTMRGDLVVAADGLWSRCRSNLLGTDDMPRPTGDLAYRVVLDLDQLDDPELKSWVNNPTVHFWIGPGAHAVGYSLRGGMMYNIVLLVPDDLPPGVSRDSGSVEEMQALFKDWDPLLGRFLSVVDQVDKWKLMHREELPSWVNEKSNFVFVYDQFRLLPAPDDAILLTHTVLGLYSGDSCHPMLPYLAQGANSAVEDGAVLGLILGHLRSKDQLPKALKMYENLRKARGDAIVKETFKQRDSFHMADGPEQEARDKIFLSQLGKSKIQGSFPSKWTCPQVQPWLYGYDAFKVVENAVLEYPFMLDSCCTD
ncbi:hypothetical protein N7516_008973 [Penicillium verrucosum]|uniref:uncharacterized protein n=1 Tax=Penicillium verrucosum TaxID=60171 RepID=UPI00254595CE|nr:uncharacterized protein N7516_008973 [Penicillium verrucosum]KAJ5927200.1 hypothetical protein N7516_008973 [Penicillium verrucosum]